MFAFSGQNGTRGKQDKRFEDNVSGKAKSLKYRVFPTSSSFYHFYNTPAA